MMLRAVLLSLLLAGAAGPAGAQGARTVAGAQGARTVNVTVYGSDPCPRGSDDEVVVCGHRPETERYRIPKELRRKAEDRPSEVSWASRVAGLEDAARPSRPDSCSPVGSYGQSGCWAKMIRDWSAARRQAQSDAAGIP
ncbi:MAG: hypothetical protein QOH81_1545 [Sphingomonadales bacterium]|jgi:hypothetical protein|nr:hypothetical protein [Sphingomonadales bacterium]